MSPCSLLQRLARFVVGQVFLFAVCGLDGTDDKFYYSVIAPDGSSNSISKCSKCPPGTYVLNDCTHGFPNSTACKSCPDGRFSPEWNRVYKCKECSHCKSSVGEVMVLACNKTHDITCGCKPGHFRENPRDPSLSKCIPYKTCPQGQGVIQPVPLYNDLSCEDCVSGHNFSDVVSDKSSCQKCRDCAAEGWNVTTDCTVKSDTVCDIKTTKSPTTLPSIPTPTSEPSSTPPGSDGNDSTLEDILGPLFGVVALVVALVVGVYCYCKRRQGIDIFDRCFGGNNNQTLHQGGSEPPSTVNSSFALDRHPRDGNHVAAQPRPEVNRDNVAYDAHTPLMQRSLSQNLELKSGKTLFDVFLWLGKELGNEHEKFIKKLPGETLTRTEWDQPRFSRMMDLRDVIVKLLEIWKEKNPHFSDDQLLNQFYSTALDIDNGAEIRKGLFTGVY